MDKTFKKLIVALLIASLFVFPMAVGYGGVQAQGFYPPTLEPSLSSDGLILFNGVAPMMVLLDPNPLMQGIQAPVEPEVQAAIEAAIANPDAVSAAFSITYQPAGTIEPLRDAVCQDFPADAKAAFNAAAAIWTATIQSPVPITISACWSNLGSTSILGYSGYRFIRKNFTGAPKTDTWYAPALANALHGSDLDPSEFDDYITYNSGFSWYYGTDGVVPAGQVDLVTVAAHEIAHGLNFSGSASYSAGTGGYGYGTGSPNIYDTFMEDSVGTKLISYTNPSTELGSLLTSGSLWFDGINANAANGGSRVKIYAPSPWVDGSSYAHLDYTFAGGANSMMVYKIGPGSSQHNPGPVTEGLLKDLGWVMAGDNFSLSVSKTGTGSGTVTSSPAGINCGSICSTSFDYYTAVTLTATASTGSIFTGWSGSGCLGIGICTVTMNAAKSVAANLILDDYVGIYYVKSVASGTGSCQSWDNACTLQTALAAATPGDEIWTAGGTYKPTTGPDRTATFQLKNGVALYGGFAGTETERTQRNPAANVTSLTGDLNGDDVVFTNNTENVYRVVTGATGATLDGFTITAGNANGSNCLVSGCGGGMYNETSNPTLTDITFSGNSAGWGGGMFNNINSNPTLTNVTFSGNQVTNAGGGMYNSSSSPSLTYVTFSGNSAGYGGGMFNSASSPTVSNVDFSSNTASQDGGGMDNWNGSRPVLMGVSFNSNTASQLGGGMHNDTSSPTLTYVYFTSNSAVTSGGGMYNNSSNPNLTNTAFSNNSAVTSGGGMYNNSSSPILIGTTFSSNSAAYTGGGMANWSGSNPALTNVTFNGNTTVAYILKGGKYTWVPSYGAGMANTSSSPTLTNVTFSGNMASTILLYYFSNYGGGMANTTNSSPTLTNVTFNGNSAANGGGGIYNENSSSSQIRNTIFWENTAPNGAQIYNDSSIPNVSYSVVQGGCPAESTCANILTADPLLGTLGDYGGFTQTIPLTTGSSAIDTGNDAVCPATDQRGVSRPKGAHCDIGAYEYYIDTTAPTVTTFTVTTPSNSFNIPITAFSATDDVAVTGYLITNSSTPPVAEAAGWTGAAPAIYTVLSDGSYTLYPWAKDAAGHVSAVFASPRPVVVDTTAPTVNTFTVTTPSNSLNIPITAFTASDDVAVTGYLITNSSTPPVAGAAGWTDTAPAIYTVLSDGSYTLYPWAKDASGNVSAVFASPPVVVVDTTAPDTQIDTHPASPSNSADASFTFSSPDSAAMFECSLGGGPYKACTSPKNYTGLVAGSHTFAVRAKDPAGNVDATPASYTWVIDLTAPDTQIDTHPANPNNSADASFTFSSADDTAAFECSLEGGAFAACTSPKGYTGLPAGSHTFAARAKDPAGNVDATPASYTWQIDLTAPTVVSSVHANPSPTNAASVDFTVTLSEDVTGVDVTDFSLTTTGVSGASVTGVSGSGGVYTVTVNTGSGNGTIRLDLPAGSTITDLAGNPPTDLPYTDGETYTITKVFTIFLPLILH